MKNKAKISLSVRQVFFSLYNSQAKTVQGQEDALALSEIYQQNFHSTLEQDIQLYESSLLLNNQGTTMIDLQNQILMNKDILEDIREMIGSALFSRIMSGEKNHNSTINSLHQQQYEMPDNTNQKIADRIEAMRNSSENKILSFKRKK
jgi:hypothetical protein